MPKIWRPVDLKEAWEIQNELGLGNYCYVAGGTWLRTQWEANLCSMSLNLISLENVSEMTEIQEQVSNGKHEIMIGSSVSLYRCLKSTLLNQYFPPLVAACKKIAAPSIRNQATIGGNIYTTAGDTIPSLLIVKAELLWFNGVDIVAEPLEQWLITLQANQFKRDNRILVGLKMATEEDVKGAFLFFTKVGRRETFTSSLVSVAGKGTLTSAGFFQNVTLAAGGGGYPIRLSEAELELENQCFSPTLFQQIYKSIVVEFQATADPFASADYKKAVAANLITSELYKISGQPGGEQRVVGS
ncbi:FAD binding domain-containing protein [Halalkalibacter alkalisediminis]|uniref:FAD binding domain-containing protein n=1 Tax=Halalkalibacter alkalisediminis TaxID=935616 RepID=A0ABV6NDU8_9BACI|nr:FAD binding domain-containing protein [Halalkalibacter alkalisediminis]